MTSCSIGFASLDLSKLTTDDLHRLFRAIRAEVQQRHDEAKHRPAASATAATDNTTGRANER